MNTLLQIEWMKARKYRTFWVFILLFALALAGVNYAIHEANTQVATVTSGQVKTHLFDTPQVWSTTAWAGGFSVFLLGLLVIVLMTNEFSYKTHRQQIMDGLSRRQFITGKWLNILAFTLLTWVLYAGVTLCMMNYSGEGNVFDGFYYAGYFFIKSALSLSVAFMFALLFKRSGLSIALYLVYGLLLEGILRHILNRVADGLGNFLPLSAGAYLVSNPFRQLASEMGTSAPAPGWFILTCFCYIFLFVWLSYRYFDRADL